MVEQKTVIKKTLTQGEALEYALSCMRHHKWDDAAKLLTIMPEDESDILLAKARLAYGQKDNQTAFDIAADLLKDHPANDFAIAFLCMLWASSGDIGKTKPHLIRLQGVDNDDPGFWSDLCMVFYRGRNYISALKACNKALFLVQNWLDLWVMKGRIERDMGRPDQAVQSFLRALSLSPNNAQIYLYLHVCFYELSDYDKAIHFLKIAKSCGLTIPSVDLGEAHCLLKQGNLAKGFRKYRARYTENKISATKPEANIPFWKGQNLSGKKLLVFCEQGYGDVIQFSRFLIDIQNKGAEITFVCRKALVELMQHSYPNITICSKITDTSGFDFQSYLIDLAIYLDLSSHNIPHRRGYIPVPHHSPYHFPHDGKPKIGLVWEGSNQHLRDHIRSLNTSDLTSLLEEKKFDWISLQLAPKTPLPEQDNIFDYTGGLACFADTAKLIDQLDLIITIDTAVAHLAAAMGKPVWIMLDKSADWRWMDERTDSYWYDTVRLFRQHKFGEWRAVIRQIEKALKQHFPA
ncbi:tetratricopeptide repeat-containing glycosyltransferase family protein [Terasakiella sp. SH-1]|uniref:tetratricopeptide repeat-containing glycosyltransferase family protein n=1 Tax=Terasakiella sp. SH-1 TaxID=2560057 RepID=UPI00107353A1|nr:tetratricopeptide repeat-containing glycosyltransferase family protein [Terasakiella sp. SH-1]